jgi:hypothetical protein
VLFWCPLERGLTLKYPITGLLLIPTKKYHGQGKTANRFSVLGVTSCCVSPFDSSTIILASEGSPLCSLLFLFLSLPTFPCALSFLSFFFSLFEQLPGGGVIKTAQPVRAIKKSSSQLKLGERLYSTDAHHLIESSGDKVELRRLVSLSLWVAFFVPSLSLISFATCLCFLHGV